VAVEEAFRVRPRVAPALADEIYSRARKLIDWESRLPVLQCMQYLPVLKAAIKCVDVFVRKGLCDANKFVRAWS